MAKTILLVDDDPMLCQLFATALARHGYQIDSVYSGVDALMYFNDHPVDLIVLDVMMAGMSGLEVLSTIRLSSDVPIILLSARADSGSRLRGMTAGANEYLSKPVTLDALVKCVRTYLGT